MAQSRLSLNLKVHKVGDWDKTRTFLRDLDPVEVVACLDNLNDLNRILEIQHDLPNAKIHARPIIQVNGVEYDGAMHLKPLAPGDDRDYLISPTSFLNQYGVMGRGGLSLYTLNEPSGEVDQETIAQLVRWLIECILLANKRGIALTVLNWGVGHPRLINSETEWDARFDDVLELLSIHRQHTLGMHLYAPADTFSRLDALIARCKKIKGGIKPPKVAITEFGYDTHGGSKQNGYRSRGITGEQYAAFGIDHMRNVYGPYIRSGIVQSIATFIWGDDASWHNFNVEDDKGWRDAILTAKREGKLTIPTATTPTTPSYQPVNFTPGKKYLLQSEGGARSVLRKTAVVSGGNNVGNNLDDKTEVILYEVSRAGIDYWYKVQVVADKREGWLSGRGGNLTFTPVPDPVEEVPAGEIDPDDNDQIITVNWPAPLNTSQKTILINWITETKARLDLLEYLLAVQTDLEKAKAFKPSLQSDAALIAPQDKTTIGQ